MCRGLSAERGAMDQPIFDEEELVTLDVTLLNMQSAAGAVELQSSCYVELNITGTL